MSPLASPPVLEPKAVAKALAAPTFTSTPKQVEFTDAVFSGESLYIAMGGGIRGTKTWGTISTLILLCKIYPGSRWAIVRKDLPTLRRNTIPSINKLRLTCEGFLGELNQSTWTYTCTNGSQLIIFPESFSTDPEFERWRGLEVNGFLLEEANEMTEGGANKAIERAGSWIIPATKENPNPKQPPPYIFFTFNPCDNWPRLWFYEPHMAGTLRAPYKYIPATAADNPYVPDAVREAWKNLPPEEYDRFVLGSWDFAADPDQLIPLEWIYAARNVDPKPGVNRLGVDPAWMGDDATVFCRTRGNTLVDIQEFRKKRTTWVADTALLTCRHPEFPVNAPDCRVDTVGIGAGVIDNLYEEHFRATSISAGGRVFPRRLASGHQSFFKFKNLRAQMWWECREKFRMSFENPEHPDAISLPQEIPALLVSDLTAMKYKIKGDKEVEVWTKQQCRDKIGRSTDYADAFIQAILDPPDYTQVAFGSLSL